MAEWIRGSKVLGQGLRRWGTALLVSVALVACTADTTTQTTSGGGSDTTVTSTEGSTPPDAGGTLESPMLSELVASGELPPLEERLPATPLVVEPIDSLGVYGGEWNTVITGPADAAWIYRTVGYDQLTRFGYEGGEAFPNLAEEIEASPDGQEFVIRLRDGVRWSDGTPFTADDVLFAYEDVLLNTDLTPAVPIWVRSGDDPAAFEKVDDFTIRATFAEPSGMFTEFLGLLEGRPLTLMPKHYLEQYHISYNPDANALAETEGFENWVALFNAKAMTTYPGHWQNPDLPTLSPWQLVEGFGEGTRVVFERNPYYWKTDPEGRQLPYIDRVVFDIVTEVEAMVVKATAGEIDLHTRHFNTPENRPVLFENQERGDYRIFERAVSFNNMALLALNLVHKDPELRDFLQSKDVRIGLSHAINRDEIITAALQRQGEPWQVAPPPGSPFYNEELGLQYTEYNVDLANEYLDQAGYVERDADGFRLLPDGERISLAMEMATGSMAYFEDVLALVGQYWAEVGIDTTVESVDRSLFFERQASNDHTVIIWSGAAGADDAVFDPRDFFPFSVFSYWAVPWANWYNGAEPSEEPPGPAQQQMEIYDEIRGTPDYDARAALFQDIVSIAQEEFYAIGISQFVSEYGIVSNSFHNVPEGILSSSSQPDPATANPEQFFIEEG